MIWRHDQINNIFRGEDEGELEEMWENSLMLLIILK